MKEKYYITTAIAYASRKPHIGNTYEIVLTDAIARYKRLKGYDVYFLTGTDEHGQKIQTLAEEAGISPQNYVDGVSGEIRRIWDLMGSSYDQFIRTTAPFHKATVQKIFKQLYDQGDIYKSEYEGWYCVPCESFFTETQLVDGKCPDCGREVSKEKEEAYFFRMSKYQDRLMKYIEENPDFICPDARRKEMVNNFLKPGLQDLCVSRTSFNWGVPVSFDDKHVTYVWIDALSNYITALGYGQEDDSLFKKYWPADVHIIGKDILRFHTIYWPIILMALGLPLPKQVFGHPWLLSGQDKMSKSKGNVLYADELVERFGVDAMRWYVLAEMPYAADGTISYENIITRYNADLANVLGNLVNRTHAMITKYFDGQIPAAGELNDTDRDLIETAKSVVAQYTEKMDGLRLAEAIATIITLLRRSNKYIDETEPWALSKKGETERLGTVLYNLSEAIRVAAVLIRPFMPTTAEKVFAMYNTNENSFESVEAFGATVAGTKLNPGEALFPRIDEKKLLAELLGAPEEKKPEPKKEKKAEKKAEEGPAPEITIDDFAKVELKVGTVLESKRVEGADRLLVSQIDLGNGDVRQIVSGIAKTYDPADFVGKQVIVAANLKPVKLRGILSCGMVLCAVDGKDLCVVSPEKVMPNGTQVR